MRTRQQPNEEQPTAAFASGAGVVRGRNWSAGAQPGDCGTSCADPTEETSPNTTNGSLQCQTWIEEEEENSMVMNDVEENMNGGRGEADMSSPMSQEYPQEFQRSQRRRVVVTSPAKINNIPINMR